MQFIGNLGVLCGHLKLLSVVCNICC